MTLPHDPHLPSTPHLAQVVVPPLIREELAKAMKTAGGRAQRRVWMHCVCVWGGGDSCRESGTGKCLVESGGGGGGVADVSVVGPEESMSLVDWWSRRWPLSAPLFYLMLL